VWEPLAAVLLVVFLLRGERAILKGQSASAPGKMFLSIGEFRWSEDNNYSKADDATTLRLSCDRSDAPVNKRMHLRISVPVHSRRITADDPGMIVRVRVDRLSLAQRGYPGSRQTPD